MGLKRFGVSLDESLLESLDLFVVNNGFKIDLRQSDFWLKKILQRLNGYVIMS